MKLNYILDESKLHPKLKSELPIAIRTTELLARTFFPMVSEKFDSIEEFSSHLQDNLLEPLSTVNALMNNIKVIDEINTKNVVQTTVKNYLAAYIKNQLINFNLKTEVKDNEIIISGYKIKIWMCKHKTIHVRFKGSENHVQYFSSKVGATYRPITEEERMYGISFSDGGIS